VFGKTKSSVCRGLFEASTAGMREILHVLKAIGKVVI